MIQFDSYFSDGLKPPTRYRCSTWLGLCTKRYLEVLKGFYRSNFRGIFLPLYIDICFNVHIQKENVYIYIHDISIHIWIYRYIIYFLHVNLLIYICWRSLAKNSLKGHGLEELPVGARSFYFTDGTHHRPVQRRNCSDIKMTQKVKNCPEWRVCLLTDYEAVLLCPLLWLATKPMFPAIFGIHQKPVNIGKQSPNISGKEIEIETLLDPFSLRMMFIHQQQPWSFCWCFRNHQLM